MINTCTHAVVRVARETTFLILEGIDQVSSDVTPYFGPTPPCVAQVGLSGAGVA